MAPSFTKNKTRKEINRLFFKHALFTQCILMLYTEKSVLCFGFRRSGHIWRNLQIWRMLMDLLNFIHSICIFLWHSCIFRLLGITLTWLVTSTAYAYIVSSFVATVDHKHRVPLCHCACGSWQLPTYHAPQSCLCSTQVHLNLSLHLHQEIFTGLAGCLWISWGYSGHLKSPDQIWMVLHKN